MLSISGRYLTSLPSAKPLSQCFPQHADHGMLATRKAMHALFGINWTTEPASGDSSRACLFLGPRRLFQAARPLLPRPNVGTSTTNSCGHGHPQASNPASTPLRANLTGKIDIAHLSFGPYILALLLLGTGPRWLQAPLGVFSFPFRCLSMCLALPMGWSTIC